MKRHSLPRLTLHGLRHTWATLALEQGTPYLGSWAIGKLLADRLTRRVGLCPFHLDGLGGVAARRVRIRLTSDRNMRIGADS